MIVVEFNLEQYSFLSNLITGHIYFASEILCPDYLNF